MSFVGFLFAAIVVHMGCMGTFCVVVENEGLLDLEFQEFGDDLFGSRIGGHPSVHMLLCTTPSNWAF